MTLMGMPHICVCSRLACVEVDDIVWLCESCAAAIEAEFANSRFSSAAPMAGESAAAASSPQPLAAAAFNSSFDGVVTVETAGASLPGSPTADAPACNSDLDAAVSALEAGWAREAKNARASRVLDAIKMAETIKSKSVSVGA